MSSNAKPRKLCGGSVWWLKNINHQTEPALTQQSEWVQKLGVFLRQVVNQPDCRPSECWEMCKIRCNFSEAANYAMNSGFYLVFL